VTSSGLTKVELFAVLRGCLVSVGARQEESAAPAMRGGPRGRRFALGESGGRSFRCAAAVA